MVFDVLIRGGRVAVPGSIAIGDLGIVGDRIAAVGDLSASNARTEIDAKGLLVMPGVIDTQVHFREPGLTHKEDLATGTLAALHGGVTSILEMPNTVPTTTSEEALREKLDRAAGRASCHYGFFIGASVENAENLAQLELLPGVPGVKIFMGSSTGSLLVSEDADLLRVFRNGRKRMPIHAEDEAMNRLARAAYHGDRVQDHPHVRDNASAVNATRRLMALCEETRRPVHILHISTHEEPEMIREAQHSGLPITAEVTPQHLFFAGPYCYDRLGTRAQMNPPIRSALDRDGLWKALLSGVFEVFGSDHAPHTLEEKSKPYPNSPSGMPGVQTLLPVLLTFVAQGRIGLEQVIEMTTAAPARLYGISDRGRIEVGAFADLTLVDTDASYTFEASMVRSKCGWSPYEGERLHGFVRHVLLNGVIALLDGEVASRPLGQMLEFA